MDEITVETTGVGSRLLVELADQHSPLRASAIEGTGDHGARLARHLSGSEAGQLCSRNGRCATARCEHPKDDGRDHHRGNVASQMDPLSEVLHRVHGHDDGMPRLDHTVNQIRDR